MSQPGSEFEFKEIDPEGYHTLKVISDAVNFNNWTYESIRPFCNGKILEIGSGIGNISDRFISNNCNITLSDIRINYLSFLRTKYPVLAKEGRIHQLDLVHPDFEIIYKELLGSFDTVFALNVVEHIEDDSLAIANCRKLLRNGGKLILLLPAFQWLYNDFDKKLCHFKRYTDNAMRTLMESSGLNVSTVFYFNAGGMPGWYVSGKLMHNKTIPQSQMIVFDKLVPIFKIVDKLLMRKVGLSVIGVGEKNGEF